MSDDTTESLTLKDVAKSPVGIAGLACALLPFFVHVTSSSTNTVNGVVVNDFFRDYPAIVLGALGVLLGVLLLARGEAPMKARAPVGVLVLVLSAWHLVTGFGLDRRTGETPPEVAAAGQGVPEGVVLPCTAATLEPCVKRCEQGNARDCNEAGALYSRGEGVTEDDAKALQLFEKACAGGVKYGCSNAASVLFTGTPSNPTRALEFWKKGCELGDADICNGLGVKLDHGEDVPEDEPAALTWFEKACALKNALGCKNAGFMVSEGRGAEKSEARAASFYEQACELGEPSGCTERGILYEAAKDELNSVPMFKKACEQKDPLGCTNLGIKLGKAGKGDLVAAQAAFQLGCAGKSGRGCFELGVMTDEGQGGLAKDAAAAVTLYDRACELGNANGCINAGVSYRDADGVAKSEDLATERFERACTKLGSSDGCYRLGLILAAQEPARARAILTPFCNDEHDKKACATIKGLKKR